MLFSLNFSEIENLHLSRFRLVVAWMLINFIQHNIIHINIINYYVKLYICMYIYIYIYIYLFHLYVHIFTSFVDVYELTFVEVSEKQCKICD